MKKASLVIKEIQEGSYNDILKVVYIDENRIEKQPQRYVEAIEKFISVDEKIFAGEAKSLISNEKDMGRVLETMKSVSRKILYTSFEAENIELTGYAVIIGILNKYKSIFLSYWFRI